MSNQQGLPGQSGPCVVAEVCGMFTWWRHQMETFSALLGLCAGNSLVPVNSPYKGQWRGALVFSLIYAWINDWVNNREAGDLRRRRGHYDVIVMEARTSLWSHQVVITPHVILTAQLWRYWLEHVVGTSAKTWGSFPFYWHIFHSSGFNHICNIKCRLDCRYSPQNIFNAKNFNPHKEPISLLNVPICAQGMQRTWWPEAGTTIVTGPYWEAITWIMISKVLVEYWFYSGFFLRPVV